MLPRPDQTRPESCCYVCACLIQDQVPKSRPRARLDLAMNENEIERIAAMGNALRPDWPVTSLRSLLARPELANRSRRDVAVALAWVACESTTKTPARVIEAGPWWIATNADGQRGRTSFNIPCPDHAGETLPCGKCAHDRVPADDNPALALARAQLASARADLCSHGVPHRACTDHRTKPEPADTEETP